ncbi:MAG: ThiF family adenylyltransferase, partial [Chitinispirillaceae bacterium]|nr:ThiF family adenylyltransferase [Chitinispirillaceae bacterium]
MPARRFSRTRLLLGEGAVQKLANASVAVFGLGGVGSYAVEALARAGVGHLRLVDFDEIKHSNFNRQLYALEATVGRKKA